MSGVGDEEAPEYESKIPHTESCRASTVREWDNTSFKNMANRGDNDLNDYFIKIGNLCQDFYDGIREMPVCAKKKYQ